MELRRESRVNGQPAGKASAIAVDPTLLQYAFISAARMQREEGIFHERAVGVLGLDRCGQPARAGGKRTRELGYRRASVYRPQLDCRRILAQPDKGFAARQRIDLGNSPQHARRQTSTQTVDL